MVMEVKEDQDGAAQHAISCKSSALRSHRLEPITKLEGNEFLKAWVDCYRSHYRLWTQGVVCDDIGLQNLMYDVHTKRGVLTDLDISRGKRRPGVFPPLTYHDKNSDKRRAYRHYCNGMMSFIWILCYALLKRCHDVRYRALLDGWSPRHHDHRRYQKAQFTNLVLIDMRSGTTQSAEQHSIDGRIWRVVRILVLWLSVRKGMFALEEFGYSPWDHDPKKIFDELEKVIGATWTSGSFVPLHGPAPLKPRFRRELNSFLPPCWKIRRAGHD
ncbi:hypothetical protein BKA93DRAFT_35372 [Sparassis latifolia]